MRERLIEQPSGALRRWRKKAAQLSKKRRFVRYGLLVVNIVVLLSVLFFVINSKPTQTTTPITQANSTARGVDDVPANPLDQLSSADIAVNVALATNLPETPGVIERADTVAAELEVPPTHTTVIAKPQVVATSLKSKKDIVVYVVQAGDSVASIAAKFGVTSESIQGSNNLTGNVVAAGVNLFIPPVNGLVYTVQNGDTPDSVARKFQANKDQIIAYNDAEISGLVLGDRIIVPDGHQPVVSAGRGRSSSFSFSFIFGGSGYNGYDRGFCTWYVANKRASIGRPIPGGLGNASSWDNRAPSAGLLVNKTPAYGAAVVTSQRGAGHVAFVEVVNDDGSIWVTEMNSRGQVSMTNTASAGGWGKVDWKFFPAGVASTFNYIH